MAKQPEHEEPKGRVIRHRVRAVTEGLRRADVTVPANNAGLVKAVAAVLRAGGDDTRRVREALTSMMTVDPMRTGAGLVAFLRASPLVGEDFTVERDRTTGRAVDLLSLV